MFLSRGPETVHTLMEIQGINYAHGKFSFRIGVWANGGVTILAFQRIDLRTPSQLVRVLQLAFSDYCLSSAVLGGARIRPAHAAVRSEST